MRLEWKQPEALRRHWLMEEIDGELMFAGVPHDAAYGRIGEEDYSLRSSGVLAIRRTLYAGDDALAVMESKPEIHSRREITAWGSRYLWKKPNPLSTQWILQDSSGEALLTFRPRKSLAFSCDVITEGFLFDDDRIKPLLLLCWYDRVLTGEYTQPDAS